MESMEEFYKELRRDAISDAKGHLLRGRVRDAWKSLDEVEDLDIELKFMPVYDEYSWDDNGYGGF